MFKRKIGHDYFKDSIKQNKILFNIKEGLFISFKSSKLFILWVISS